MIFTAIMLYVEHFRVLPDYTECIQSSEIARKNRKCLYILNCVYIYRNIREVLLASFFPKLGKLGSGKRIPKSSTSISPFLMFQSHDIGSSYINWIKALKNFVSKINNWAKPGRSSPDNAQQYPMIVNKSSGHPVG